MASAADNHVNGAEADEAAGENEPLLGRSDSITQKDDHPIQNNLIVGPFVLLVNCAFLTVLE
jgi:hypothetical protein